MERSDLDCGLTSGAVDEGLCDRVTTVQKRRLVLQAQAQKRLTGQKRRLEEQQKLAEQKRRLAEQHAMTARG